MLRMLALFILGSFDPNPSPFPWPGEGALLVILGEASGMVPAASPKPPSSALAGRVNWPWVEPENWLLSLKFGTITTPPVKRISQSKRAKPDKLASNIPGSARRTIRRKITCLPVSNCTKARLRLIPCSVN